MNKTPGGRNYLSAVERIKEEECGIGKEGSNPPGLLPGALTSHPLAPGLTRKLTPSLWNCQASWPNLLGSDRQAGG